MTILRGILTIFIGTRSTMGLLKILATGPIQHGRSGTQRRGGQSVFRRKIGNGSPRRTERIGGLNPALRGDSRMLEARWARLHHRCEGCQSEHPDPIIACKVQPGSVVYTDSYRPYDTLDITNFRHFRINHLKLFADRQNHINGIENFWNQAKRHLRKFNGIPRQNFPLFLKECEWRFNYGPSDQLLKILQK